MNIKNIFFAFLGVVTIGIGLSSCGDDSDENDNGTTSDKISKSAEKFVGFWKMDGVYFNKTQKYPSTVCFLLSKDGRIYYASDEKEIGYHDYYRYVVNEGKWQYDEHTHILSTTARWSLNKNIINPQWEITFVDNNSWSGLALWDNNTNTSLTAYCPEGDYDDDYGDTYSERVDENLVSFFLSDTRWVNEKGILDIGYQGFDPAPYINKRQFFRFIFHGNKIDGALVKGWKYNRSTDSVEAKDYSSDGGGTITIHNITENQKKMVLELKLKDKYDPSYYDYYNGSYTFKEKIIFDRW